MANHGDGDEHHHHYGRYVAIAIAVSVGAIVTIAFLTMDRNTLHALSRIDAVSFIVVIGLVVGKWACECVRFSLIIRAIGRHLPFSQTSKSVLGSAFTGSVTPYRSATVPVQIFFFTRYGLTGGEATAVSTTGAALSVILLTISMPTVLIIAASEIHFSFGIRFLLVMGATIGFLVFMAIVYSMRDPSRVPKILTRITPQRVQQGPRFQSGMLKLIRGMDDFSASLRRLVRASKGLLGAIILLTGIYWFAEVFIASWILRGLGYPQFFWKALLAQLVVSSVLPFTPVPGESGVAEAAFATVFSVFIPRNIVAVVTLIWRFFIFYLPLVGLGTAFIMATNDAARIGEERRVQEEESDTRGEGAEAPDEA